jgi:hypothetical protein
MYYSKNEKYIPIAGILLGGVVFCAMYGTRILDPTFFEWTMRGDAAQTFIGWHFFRHEPWTFPLGKISSYLYPQGTSIVYTGSTPLIVIFLKLFSPVLSPVFQYHGIWLLSCYLLQGYFAILLAGHITRNFTIRLLLTLFFLLPPTILHRAGEHKDLCAHWLITASLYLYFQRDNLISRLQWIALLSISSAIQFYLLAMAFVIFLGYRLRLLLSDFNHRSLLATLQSFTLTSATVLLTMWSVGYFIIKPSNASAWGWGWYSMNLLAPLNPAPFDKFAFFQPVKLVASKYEGFNYFGLGLILLIAIAMYEAFHYRKSLCENLKKPFVLPLVLISVLLLCISVSNTVTIGDFKVIIPIPKFLEKLAQIVRASGRMFWPVTYILTIGSVALLHRLHKTSRMIMLLSLLVGIQVIDLYPVYSNINFQKGYFPLNFGFPLEKSSYHLLKSQTIWQELMKGIEHIVFVPPDENHQEDYLPFAWLAANYQKTLNTGYVARFDSQARNDYIDNMMHKISNEEFEFNEDSLYIIREQEIAEGLRLPSSMELSRIDGYYVVFAQQHTS